MAPTTKSLVKCIKAPRFSITESAGTQLLPGFVGALFASAVKASPAQFFSLLGTCNALQPSSRKSSALTIPELWKAASW
jgi:hypothetical protein